jgi:hypothetical protein
MLMFTLEARPTRTSGDRVFGQFECDRCGHVADEANIHSGYINFGMLRFRARPGSAFGCGCYVEGDFCDACLFSLVGRYVRVVEGDWPHAERGGGAEAPRRLSISEDLKELLTSQQGTSGTGPCQIIEREPAFPHR